MVDEKDVNKLVAKITKRYLDEGKIIEAGFAALRIAQIPKDASPKLIKLLRSAFFAGAQHLYASMMAGMDDSPGAEPTENDVRRMDKINGELSLWVESMKAQQGKPN